MKFEEFILQAKSLSTKKDFKLNNRMLASVKPSSYETVLSLLKIRGRIQQSIWAYREVTKISAESSLTELEVVRLSPRFGVINSFLDKGF